jgi:single-strand DNA-binding protein
LRYTPSGKQVVEFTVLVNERRLNSDTAEWEDGEPTRLRVKAFRPLGENIAESQRKGDREFVHGTPAPTPGPTRTPVTSAPARMSSPDIVGPSLRWAAVRITKTNLSRI